jgi:nanoRNase/pAp phosphatase (c-di-AMP/oligoRNAs hydrolase)
VTLIGHNAQIVPTVAFFVGARIPVRVYTNDPGLDDRLAPYPGVQVHHLAEDYDQPPADLPGAPYFVGVEDSATADRIRAWLPSTSAVFLLRPETRRGHPPAGFLSLLPPQSENRQQVMRRLDDLRRLDRLLALARGRKHALILMYRDPDPDAIGAALALNAIWRSAGVEAEIRHTGEVQRYQNKLLLSWLSYPIERLRDGELAAADLVAVVDAQPGFWTVDPPAADVVIDHHPPRPDTTAAFTDLRPDYGSTSTILSEYLAAADLPVDRQLATALLYGIVTDTDDLKRHASTHDIRAFERLHDRADRHFLARLEKSQVPMATLDYIAWAISHRVVYREMVLIFFGEVPNVDVCVQVADLVLLTCGITWVVCAGIHAGHLVAVFRGDGHRQDVGRRATLAFGKIGSAGGHRTMGRAEVDLDGASPDEAVGILVGNLFRRMSPKRRQRIMRTLKAHLQDAGPADPERCEVGV